MPLTLNSTAFGQGEPIPTRYTGDGQDVSPPLSWSGAPQGTQGFALICDDPDAPTPQPFVHWVIYNMPPHAASLPEGVAGDTQPAEPAGSAQGVNHFNSVGYRGPAPPKGHGVHHYHFKLYALDSQLNVSPSTDKESLLAALDGHILEETELVGTYER